MNLKKIVIYCITIIMLLSMSIGVAMADDGVMFRRNISKTPDQETERAAIGHMTFYVPAQSADGALVDGGIQYFRSSEDEGGEDVLVDTREFAKPLVSVYIDGKPEEETKSGAGFGAHDAYAALSLDDGASWKRTNLSNSAELSSFNLANGLAYPGDAHNMTFAIAGDKVLVGWISKYCDGGLPAYSMLDEDDKDGDSNITEKLYPDIWGVAGSQKSVDYTLQGFPEVGEIPYSCVWSARGKLLPVILDDGSTGYDIIWTKAERLTSGRRDANRLEMNGDSSTGFMMVWQEDPEGLRPGQGLGPGEGWSGAVVNGQTDLWYSAISMEDFELVHTSDDNLTPIVIDAYDYNNDLSTIPKVAVPMALPVRLTDNAMCKVGGNADGSDDSKASPSYCFIDFDNVDTNGNLLNAAGDILTSSDLPIAQSTDSTYCTETIAWETSGGATLQVCVAKDGRVMQGRVGASRPRVNVQPYDSDGDGLYDSSWVILGAEESKALGEGSSEETGGGQPEEEDPIDIGKNMWYYSFDMLKPDVVQQGGMLNWPARCTPHDEELGKCTEGDILSFQDPLYDDPESSDPLVPGNILYETEISRRFSHMSQPIHQIGPAGISSVLIVKQGILNQGGPADIFLRMTKVPDTAWVDCPASSPYDKCLPGDYNPYAYENMVCDEWAYQDGSNPRYLEGLCLTTGINVSGGSIVACDGVADVDGACADNFPWDGAASENSYPKVTQWVQTKENLDDESWENPYDVSKGHRGFIDGDFIMMMYAWSPNWKANSVGNDHYNLYARRSFDGGLTWTTTPAALGGDGTETCENYGAGKDYITECTTYGAGEFEQARNLSQLTGNKETILDPRYSPTGGIKMLPITDKLDVGGGTLPYADDAERDPSKFFIVYETGDNTTVDVGEAIPMDLFYSRSENWGDDYDLVEYTSGDDEVTQGFDWLEHDKEILSGEASNTANPAGSYYYVVWNQWQEDEHENVTNSDIYFRRLFFEDNTDRLPVASLVYSGAIMVDTDEELTLLALARDFDRLGDGDEIVEFEWKVDDVVDRDCTGNRFNAPPRTLSIGWHGFSVRAKDNDGGWSKPVKIDLYVAEDIYRIHLPMTVNP